MVAKKQHTLTPVQKRGYSRTYSRKHTPNNIKTCSDKFDGICGRHKSDTDVATELTVSIRDLTTVDIQKSPGAMLRVDPFVEGSSLTTYQKEKIQQGSAMDNINSTHSPKRAFLPEGNKMTHTKHDYDHVGESPAGHHGYWEGKETAPCSNLRRVQTKPRPRSSSSWDTATEGEGESPNASSIGRYTYIEVTASTPGTSEFTSPKEIFLKDPVQVEGIVQSLVTSPQQLQEEPHINDKLLWYPGREPACDQPVTGRKRFNSTLLDEESAQNLADLPTLSKLSCILDDHNLKDEEPEAILEDLAPPSFSPELAWHQKGRTGIVGRNMQRILETTPIKQRTEAANVLHMKSKSSENATDISRTPLQNKPERSIPQQKCKTSLMHYLSLEDASGTKDVDSSSKYLRRVVFTEAEPVTTDAPLSQLSSVDRTPQNPRPSILKRSVAESRGLSKTKLTSTPIKSETLFLGTIDLSSINSDCSSDELEPRASSRIVNSQEIVADSSPECPPPPAEKLYSSPAPQKLSIAPILSDKLPRKPPCPPNHSCTKSIPRHKQTRVLQRPFSCKKLSVKKPAQTGSPLKQMKLWRRPTPPRVPQCIIERFIGKHPNLAPRLIKVHKLNIPFTDYIKTLPNGIIEEMDSNHPPQLL